MKISTYLLDDITAYSDSGQSWIISPKLWKHDLTNSYVESYYVSRWVISLQGPIEYSLSRNLFDKVEKGIQDKLPFILDMNGQHFGVNESVKVSCEDFLKLLNQASRLAGVLDKGN